MNIEQELSGIHIAVSSLGSNINDISRGAYRISELLESLNQTFVELTKQTLLTASMRLLQEENAKLTLQLSEQERRSKKIMSILLELSSSCVGCRKDRWQPHRLECEWASDLIELLDKLGDEHELALKAAE